MDTANQQRILGYFIEEAKEHLQTLEQGILQLATSVRDAETVNEMFRAAHSVKGGAAMLGYTSIQKTAHRLEDSFKILKDNQVDVDQKLESLFLNGYDHLQDLIERLESSADFSDSDAVEILAQAESNFAVLDKYLQQLLSGGSSDGASLNQQVTTILKQMLQQFKQSDTPESRQKLHIACNKLGEIAPNEANWQTLVATTQKAITNKKYPYATIAQVVIKEIKQAGDFLDSGQISKLAPSKNLQQLAATAGGTSSSASAGSTITISRDPQEAALTLLKNFNKQQIMQMFQIIKTRL
ncbi:Hpt domain-containing protein [Waterburya agarophytonicola K14]|uniref:Hpt domain-containing protein n=1 Tax=Waterburya agarophytonicola KI4 TaxID=2874699 RepID=A0A964BPI0_9CYAN|nr:Hpt domain-containing protein [Waterburya agarophytonicola]MCC0176123.1 Hpt domain-containing protein [Waterburya agarophytonicola KI4]